MRRNSFLVVFSMTLVLLAGSSINLRAQTKSRLKKRKRHCASRLQDSCMGMPPDSSTSFSTARICRWWESPKPIVGSRHNLQELRLGARSLLFRPGGNAEGDPSSGGTRVHEHLRSSRRGGDLRAVWRARDDGKAAGGQFRRCAGHRESGARGQDSGFGELRNDLVSQQSSRIRSGAR